MKPHGHSIIESDDEENDINIVIISSDSENDLSIVNKAEDKLPSQSFLFSDNDDEDDDKVIPSTRVTRSFLKEKRAMDSSKSITKHAQTTTTTTTTPCKRRRKRSMSESSDDSSITQYITKKKTEQQTEWIHKVPISKLDESSSSEEEIIVHTPASSRKRALNDNEDLDSSLKNEPLQDFEMVFEESSSSDDNDVKEQAGCDDSCDDDVERDNTRCCSGTRLRTKFIPINNSFVTPKKRVAKSAVKEDSSEESSQGSSDEVASSATKLRKRRKRNEQPESEKRMFTPNRRSTRIDSNTKGRTRWSDIMQEGSSSSGGTSDDEGMMARMEAVTTKKYTPTRLVSQSNRYNYEGPEETLHDSDVDFIDPGEYEENVPPRHLIPDSSEEE